MKYPGTIIRKPKAEKQSSFPSPFFTENTALSIRTRTIYIGHRTVHQVNLHSGEQIDGLRIKLVPAVVIHEIAVNFAEMGHYIFK